MVFEKLKKIFKGEPEEPEVRALSLDELEKEIESLKKDAISGVENASAPMLEELSTLRNRLKDEAETLSGAETKEEVHPRLYKSAGEAKRLLIDKISRATDGMDPPSEVTWENLQSFNSALTRGVNLLGRAVTSHGRYVGMLFGQEMQMIGRLAQRAQGAASRLNDALEHAKSRIHEFDEISSAVGRYRELVQRSQALRGRLKSLEARAGELQKAQAKETEEIEHLTKSDDFRKLEDLEKRRSRIEGELKGVQSSINSTVSSIARPLRKMRKLATAGEYPLDRGAHKALDSYLDDPFRAAFSETDDLPNFASILQHLQKVIQEEKIKLRPRERRKKLGHIKELLQHRTLAGLREKYTRLEGELKAAREEYEQSSLLKRKSQLEKSLEGYRSELKRSKDETAAAQEELGEAQGELEGTKQKIKEAASKILGVQIKEL
jgi:predicted  nucleic acid-binding Zn-ribbon protein